MHFGNSRNVLSSGLGRSSKQLLKLREKQSQEVQINKNSRTSFSCTKHASWWWNPACFDPPEWQGSSTPPAASCMHPTRVFRPQTWHWTNILLEIEVPEPPGPSPAMGCLLLLQAESPFWGKSCKFSSNPSVKWAGAEVWQLQYQNQHCLELLFKKNK